jgi:hypothetical protein
METVQRLYLQLPKEIMGYHGIFNLVILEIKIQI